MRIPQRMEGRNGAPISGKGGREYVHECKRRMVVRSRLSPAESDRFGWRRHDNLGISSDARDQASWSKRAKFTNGPYQPDAAQLEYDVTS